MLARHDAPYLAQSLDAPVERLGFRAPQEPVWLCEVRSDPRHPDLSDAQWAGVARRMVAATGIAPPGDPDACRWIALRNQDRHVVIVATRVREDGGIHNPYRDAFRLQTECRRVAADLGNLPPVPHPTSHLQEPAVPITVTITSEPSGSVVARGGDSVAGILLDHAGFAFANDCHGPRHWLPTSMDGDEQAAIASHAAQMLTAAKYTVGLDPALDRSTPATAPQSLDDHLLHLTDRIRGARSGAEFSEAIGQFLHPEHGVLERVREALEAAGEQITDLDDEAYQLADRFAIAGEFVTAAEGELVGVDRELVQISSPEPFRVQPASREAALAKSPAAVQAGPARTTSSAAPNAPTPASTSHLSSSGTRAR
jgi:hypothetical protein